MPLCHHHSPRVPPPRIICVDRGEGAREDGRHRCVATAAILDHAQATPCRRMDLGFENLAYLKVPCSTEGLLMRPRVYIWGLALVAEACSYRVAEEL